MRIDKIQGLFSVTCLLLCGAVRSQAGTIDYSVTGIFPAGVATTSVSQASTPFTLTFSLPSNPVPTSFTNASDFVVNAGATLHFGSSTVNLAPAGLDIFNTSLGGGFAVTYLNGSDSILFSFGSAQLYLGAEATPTLLTGTFTLPLICGPIVGINGTITGFDSPGNLTATASTGVPEPGTLGMLFVAGLFVVGAMLSRRTRQFGR